MKKVFVIQEILPEFRVPFFNRLGAVLNVVAYHSSPSQFKRRKEISIPMRGLTFVARRVSALHLFGGRLSLNLQTLRDVFREKPEAIVLEARLGFLTAILLSLFKPKDTRVFWWLSGWESSHYSWIKTVKRRIWRSVFRRADGFICYGNSTREYLSSLGINHNVHVAFNSLDNSNLQEIVAQFREQENWLLRRRQLRMEKWTGWEADVQLLYVGRVEEFKEIPTLLSAMHIVVDQNPDLIITLRVVGDGSVVESLLVQRDSLDLGGVVEFFGPCYDPEVLAELLAVADVFVLPGNGGLAVNQAISAGLPVVLSSADGTERDMVRDFENGLYFERGSAIDLAEKIQLLIDQPEYREIMSERSVEISKTVSNIDNMVQGFLTAISGEQSEEYQSPIKSNQTTHARSGS